MSVHVGVTWASRGWFAAVTEADGDWTTELFPSIWSLWRAHRNASLILIDIPIGLPGSERRRCDVAAKRFLGDRHSAVYYAPVRAAVYERSLSAAKTRNERAGYSIQNQTWTMVPRIREVDEFLDARPGARDRLRETRPEVCFHALAHERLGHSPREPQGVVERRKILNSAAPEAETAYEEAVTTFTRPRYAPMVSHRGPILAAFVAAVTANRDPDLATLPTIPPRDERGLVMEIVYPASDRQLTLSSLDGNPADRAQTRARN